MLTAKKKKELQEMLDKFQRTCQTPFRGDAEFQDRKNQKQAIIDLVENIDVPRKIETIVRIRPGMTAEDYMFRIQMFTIMLIETDKWALSLHGTTKQELTMRMNRYREVSNAMINFTAKHFDIDAMEDMGEVFSKVMEMLRANDQKSRLELFALMKSWVNNEINFIHDGPIPENDAQEIEVNLNTPSL